MQKYDLAYITDSDATRTFGVKITGVAEKKDNGHFYLVSDVEQEKAQLQEELELQNVILDPGDGINEQKRYGYTIQVLRKDLWFVQSNRERDEALVRTEQERADHIEIIGALIARNAKLEEQTKLFNPCGHSLAESAACDICGYPDSRRLIAGLNMKLTEVQKQLEFHETSTIQEDQINDLKRRIAEATPIDQKDWASACNQKCKEWHDNLPTVDDLKEAFHEMVFCKQCVGEHGACCDFCKFYNFNGKDGVYVGEGHCQWLFKKYVEHKCPDDLCGGFYCKYANP